MHIESNSRIEEFHIKIIKVSVGGEREIISARSRRGRTFKLYLGDLVINWFAQYSITFRHSLRRCANALSMRCSCSKGKVGGTRGLSKENEDR